MSRMFFIISILVLTTNLYANNSRMMSNERGVIPITNIKTSKSAVVIEIIMNSLVCIARESRDFVDMKMNQKVLEITRNTKDLAFGIYMKDEYILSPVVQNSASEGEYVGLILQYSF